MCTGHCFAAGIFFALTHDWRVSIKNSNHIFCANEVEIQRPIPPSIAEIIKCKIYDPTV
jgi:hypothetical protein